jgi:hypothetical protein
MNNKKFKLYRDVGSAEKGTLFIRGLHGKPDFKDYKETLPDDWYWEIHTKKEDNAFLHKNVKKMNNKEKTIDQVGQATPEELKEQKRKCWNSNCNKTAHFEVHGWRWCFKHWRLNYKYGIG